MRSLRCERTPHRVEIVENRHQYRNIFRESIPVRGGTRLISSGAASVRAHSPQRRSPAVPAVSLACASLSTRFHTRLRPRQALRARLAARREQRGHGCAHWLGCDTAAHIMTPALRRVAARYSSVVPLVVLCAATVLGSAGQTLAYSSGPPTSVCNSFTPGSSHSECGAARPVVCAACRVPLVMLCIRMRCAVALHCAVRRAVSRHCQRVSLRCWVLT